MLPLIIDVDGSSTISRWAERAIASISVSSGGDDQQQVATKVTAVVKTLQAMLRELSKNESPLGATQTESASAITHWSMNNLSTSSYVIYQDDDHRKRDLREE